MRNPKTSDLRDRFLALAVPHPADRHAPGWRAPLARHAPARAGMARGGRCTGALTVLLVPKTSRGEHGLLPLSGDEDRRPARSLRAGLDLFAGRLFPEARDIQRHARRRAAARLAGRFRARSKAAHACSPSTSSGRAIRCLARCAILKPGEPAREAAIWHNRLFNPALPDTVHVVAFQPDWASAKSDRGARRPKKRVPLEFAVGLVQLLEWMIGRGLEADQKLARQHVAVLLIVGQLRSISGCAPSR